MPAYMYRCEDNCEAFEEVWHWSIPREKPLPPTCALHGEMFRDFHAEHHGHKPGSVYPYMHPHITGDGKAIEVRSEAHYKQLLREHSIKRSIAAYGEANADPEFMKARPDAAFIDEQVDTGPNGERVKVESSGVGRKGCWIGIPALVSASQEERDEFFKRGKEA